MRECQKKKGYKIKYEEQKTQIQQVAGVPEGTWLDSQPGAMQEEAGQMEMAAAY